MHTVERINRFGGRINIHTLKALLTHRLSVISPTICSMDVWMDKKSRIAKRDREIVQPPSRGTPEVILPRKKPSPPDVTPEFARFLGWLKKRSCLFPLKKCESYWIKKGFDIQENIRYMFDRNFIYIGILNGEKGIHVKDQGWANQWMTFYDLSIPHHRQMAKI